MVNVIVNTRKKASVTGALTGADMSITLRNTLNFSPNDLRLDKMKDVYEPLNPATGDTLVYNFANDTYVVKKLSIENIANVDILTIDGGTF